jgi:hypothetical protein
MYFTSSGDYSLHLHLLSLVSVKVVCCHQFKLVHIDSGTKLTCFGFQKVLLNLWLRVSFLAMSVFFPFKHSDFG